MKNNKKLATEWFRKGDEDEKSIGAILKENGAPSTACFLSQQMAEKYLKGYLIYQGEKALKIHDLVILFNLVKKIDPAFRKFQKAIEILNRYYVTTRYPADFPEGFSKDTAREAFGFAQEIKDFIFNKIFEA
ncbi:HEPN domain-containing protein [Patescibacteria group bacterium]|nr:HEPN domain-containing protein [Patescibacteria group bacterium]